MRERVSISAVVIAALLVVGPAPGAAQSQTVTVDDLKTPSSPGFVVLGVEPTSVQRPTTPRAVGLSLLSSVRDGGNLIPKNYAFEVAPYWLASRPSLTYEDWNSAGVAQTMLHSFALSFATTSVAGQNGQKSATGTGVGVRTLLLKGRETQAARAVRDEIEILQAEMRHPNTTHEREDVINVELREQALQLQTLNRQRAGWVLEIAAAIGAKVEDGNFDRGQVTRYGFWATPGYRLYNPLRIPRRRALPAGQGNGGAGSVRRRRATSVGRRGVHSVAGGGSATRGKRDRVSKYRRHGLDSSRGDDGLPHLGRLLPYSELRKGLPEHLHRHEQSSIVSGFERRVEQDADGQPAGMTSGDAIRTALSR